MTEVYRSCLAGDQGDARAVPSNHGETCKFPTYCDISPLLQVDHLGTLADNTTRRNQLAIAKCVGALLKAWRLPQHLSKSPQTCNEIFAKIAKIISTLLLIPKYAQLRTETLQVLGQAIKLLVESKSSDLVYLFRDEITRSLDGVIKDLGSDPGTKTTARDLKTALHSIQLVEATEAKWAEEKQ